MADIPLVLLAAGGSTRMSQPKQLLPWGDQTLIEYQIKTLQKTGNPVLVVAGANASQVVPVIEKYPVQIVVNEDWETGMGSSVAAGIRLVMHKFPDAAGVLFALTDQPLVPVEYFLTVLETYRPGRKQIIVSRSANGWQGVPALFDKVYFDELRNLNGEQGAKTIIQKHKSSVIYVESSDIMEDMDTPEAYHRLWEKFTDRF